MPPKEKKGKKSKKSEEEDQDDSELTAVDKQFYELTIADINKKLARLRTHNVKIEEKNEELEMRMKQMEEDRQDITAFLDRTLKEKVNTIQELEDKLSELSKVRHEENEIFKKRMQEWENKYKAMHDNLTSEIKLLTGKLNSMEEFRLQRDDLMAKFDTQEFELKEQAKKHKAIIYEMERKVILDKERMRKDVENKLLELSTEFTKTSELRVAASTQRILRENIALNNDMDRVLAMQNRLKHENEEMNERHKNIVSQYEASVAEKKRLIKTGQQQLDVINKLTKENENLKDLNNFLIDIKRSHEVARKMTRESKSELTDLRQKIIMLEQHIHIIDNDRHVLKEEASFHQKEYTRISDIIKTVRLTLKSAIKGEKTDDDPTFRESQRNNLLTDLLNILNNLENCKPKAASLVTIPSVTDFYNHGDLGFLPKDTDTLLESLPALRVDSRFLTPSIASTETEDATAIEEEKSELENIIDPVSGTISFESERKNSLVSEESEQGFSTFANRATKRDTDSVQTKKLSIDLRQSLEAHSNDEDEIRDKESIILSSTALAAEAIESTDEVTQ